MPSDMTHCYRCGADYSTGSRWVRGFDACPDSTAGICFVPCAEVPAGYCPVCNKPPQLEPTPRGLPM